MSEEELYKKTVEETYNKIVELISSGNFLQLNSKPISLTELSNYINTQQQEIERLHSIIKEVREYCENNKEFTQRLEDILEILDKEKENEF